jgi:hypothetical protein
MRFRPFGHTYSDGGVDGVPPLLKLPLDWLEKSDDRLVLLEPVEGVLLVSGRLGVKGPSVGETILSPCGIVSADVRGSDLDIDSVAVSVPLLTGVVTASISTML